MTFEDHVFLSYRTKEEAFALQLYARLRDAGINVWMDRFSITVGDDWMMSIQQALDGCGAMVAVISPLYLESNYCLTEIHRVSTRRPAPGTIYPLLLKPVDPEERPLEIQRLQHIDFTQHHDFESDGSKFRMQKLIEVLQTRHPAYFGPVPDVLERYVNYLIADLEEFQGVLEYVDLGAAAHTVLEDTEASGAVIENNPRREEYRRNPREGRLAPGLGLITQTLQHNQREVQTEPIDSWHAALQKMPHFVLLGDPGSGKSTMLRRMAVDTGHIFLRNRDTAPIPFYVRLPEWNRDISAIDFIRMQWHDQQLPAGVDPIAFLQQGKAILYLDGLDELGSGGRSKASYLRDWLHSPVAPRYAIITCRTEEYTEVLSLGIPTVAVQPMSETQIDQFVTNYLPEQHDAFMARLQQSGGDSPIGRTNLIKLASNPYLLSALILAYQSTPSGEDLPTNPGRLTEVIVKALWEREESKQSDGWVHYRDMEVAFANLAFAIIEGEMPNDVHYTFAIEHAGSYGLLAAGQNANIITIDDEYVRFYHEMMQDYFAAVKLKQVGFVARLQPPVFTSQMRIPNKWDHALLALAGIVKKPDAVITDIAGIDPYLAQGCISSDIPVSDGVVTAVVQRLVGVFDIDINWRQYATDLMSYENTHNAKRQLATSCLRALGSLAVPMLLYMLQDPNQNALIKRNVMFVLGYAQDPRAIHTLMEIVTRPDLEQQAVQAAMSKARTAETMNQAVQFVGQVGKTITGRQRTTGDHVNRDKLSYAVNPDDLTYRWLALQALILFNDPDHKPFFAQVAAQDPDPMLRHIAAGAG